jgi:hypothetical protein
VSCCLECNSRKRDEPAADFLRSPYRERRLSSAEFKAVWLRTNCCYYAVFV